MDAMDFISGNASLKTLLGGSEDHELHTDPDRKGRFIPLHAVWSAVAGGTTGRALPGMFAGAWG